MLEQEDVETSDTCAGVLRASAAAPATATTTAATSTTSRAPPGLREAILGTSLWEAAYDQDQALSSSAAEEREEDDDNGGEPQQEGAAAVQGVEPGASSSLHSVTVDRAAKLGIRVRDDLAVTHFDPLPATGEPGPIETSGVVQVGDVLVEVDGVNVEGKGVREMMALLRGAAHDSVTLTFRRFEPKPPHPDEVGVSASASASASGSTTGPNPLHLTEQHRALILRHLLVGSGPHIAEDRLRFMAAHGVPDCDGSLRPLVWRILLQYLGCDRDGWEEHLKGQRQIYAQFVADLCVLPEETAGQGETQGPPEQSKQATAAAVTAAVTGAGASAPATVTAFATAAAADESSASPRRKKKLLVPSSSPPGSHAASHSFGLDTSASFAALNRMPVAAAARRRSSISASTSTSSGSGDGLEASVMGASAAGSQPHFAYARPRTRVRYQGDRSLFDEIKRDVVRTYPDQAFFLDVEEGWRRYDALLRALFIYAKVHPGIRYVQGMNEILGTIYYVLAHDDPARAAHAEADTFFLFNNLMAQLRDLFQAGLDQADSGIEGKIEQLVHLLARHDPQLHAHFGRLNLDARFFALRWITTLFSRELLLADTIRVWDSLLADAALGDFVLFFCLAMLEEQRDTLLGLGFGECLSLLQNYPATADVQSLLRRAEALRQHDARVRRGEQQHNTASRADGGTLSPTRLRGVLAKVASTIEDLELDAVAASLSTEGRRAGAQLRSSFAIFTRRLVENLSVLDSEGAEPGGGGGGGGGGGAKALPALPAAAAAAAGEEQEEEHEEDEEELEMVAADKGAVPTAT